MSIPGRSRASESLQRGLDCHCCAEVSHRPGVWGHPREAVISTFGNDRRVIIETRQAGVGDLKRASEVGEAFADYPWTRWTIDPDDHQARVTRLQLLALETLGLTFGEVWLSSLEGMIQSVAVWMDSAVLVPSSVLRALDPVVAQFEGSRHDASLAAQREDRGMAASAAPLHLGRPRNSAGEAKQGPGSSDVGPRTDQCRP